MTQIPLSAVVHAYNSDQQKAVHAWRWYADVLLVDQTGILLPHRCVLDTGAALGVLPFSIWKGRRLQWRDLGTQWTSRGRSIMSELTWQGIACHLRECTVWLVDPKSGVQTGPHRLVAKFVRQRLPPRLEQLMLLGANFCPDNGIDLDLNCRGSAAMGCLDVPGP